MLYDADNTKYCMKLGVFDAQTNKLIEEVNQVNPEEGWFLQYYYDGKPQVVIKNKEGDVHTRVVTDTPFYLKSVVTGEKVGKYIPYKKQ
jgi:hypothetical protein